MHSIRISELHGDVQEHELFEFLPSIDNIDDSHLLFENRKYQLSLTNSNVADEVEIAIGDYIISTSYESNSDSYESTMDIHFSGCFDLCVFGTIKTERSGT